MPDRYLPTRVRRWAWPFTIGLLLALAVTTTTVSVVVYYIRSDVITIQAGKNFADVATCYSAARGRPATAVVLRLVAGLAESPSDRQLVNSAIDRYVGNAPSVADCDELAMSFGLDPLDFPPPTVGTR